MTLFARLSGELVLGIKVALLFEESISTTGLQNEVGNDDEVMVLTGE